MLVLLRQLVLSFLSIKALCAEVEEKYFLDYDTPSIGTFPWIKISSRSVRFVLCGLLSSMFHIHENQHLKSTWLPKSKAMIFRSPLIYPLCNCLTLRYSAYVTKIKEVGDNYAGIKSSDWARSLWIAPFSWIMVEIRYFFKLANNYFHKMEASLFDIVSSVKWGDSVREDSVPEILVIEIYLSSFEKHKINEISEVPLTKFGEWNANRFLLLLSLHFPRTNELVKYGNSWVAERRYRYSTFSYSSTIRYT